jgi:hypothetical protein
MRQRRAASYCGFCFPDSALAFTQATPIFDKISNAFNHHRNPLPHADAHRAETITAALAL